MNGTTSLLNEKRFSMKQAAEILGVSIATVSRLASLRRIGFYNVKSKYVFSENHLADYLRKNESKAKAA